MNRIIVFFLLILSGRAFSSEFVWNCQPRVLPYGEVYGVPEIHGFNFSASIYIAEDDGTVRFSGASVDVDMYGHNEDVFFYLKQFDHKTSPMPVDNDVFVAAFYGDTLGADTIMSAARVTLASVTETESATGGTLVGREDDFYLGFIVTEKENFYIKEDSREWYAWVRISYDGSRFSVIDSDANLLGGPITVGEHWSPEPEPAAGMLAALGLAALLLRRRFGR